jgi:hypothetical protein
VPAALPFDTLDYARKLEAAGVPSAQAELQARALNDAIVTSVASRDDLTRLEGRLDGKFESLDAKLENLEIRLDAKFANVDAKFANVDLRLVNLESRLNTRIDTVNNELKLEFGGKIETLKWMFATLVVLNGAMLVQLFLRH